MQHRNRAPLPPFREGDLLSVSRFISYCRDHGVRIQKEHLELYDRLNLLTPAVIVFHPIVPFEKVRDDNGKEVYRGTSKERGKNVYYHVGGISFRGETFRYRYFGHEAQKKNDDSLEYCKTISPAETLFREWKSYSIPNHGFVKTKKELGLPAELYYSPEQILALVEIKQSHRLLLSGTSEDIIREVGFLQTQIEKQYRAIQTYYLGERIWFDLIKEKAKAFDEQAIIDGLTQNDFEAMMKAWEERDKKSQIEEALTSQTVTSDELRRMAEPFIYKGFQTDPNIEIFEYYWTNVPIHLHKKQKGLVRLADLYYRISKRLLWLLDAFEKNIVTLDEYYRTRGHRFMEICVVCGAGFMPNPKRHGGRKQKTCSQTCGEEYKKIWKRNRLK